MRKILYILAELGDADIDWIVGAGRLRQVEPGTALIRKGQPLDWFYIVVDGSFEVRAGERLLGRLFQGEVLGELSFLDSRPPSATVVALDRARVLSIPKDVLEAKLEQDTAFAAHFYKSLGRFMASRLRDATTTLAYGTVEMEDEEVDADELDLDGLDSADMAARRFQWMLDRLAGAR